MKIDTWTNKGLRFFGHGRAVIVESIEEALKHYPKELVHYILTTWRLPAGVEVDDGKQGKGTRFAHREKQG